MRVEIDFDGEVDGRWIAEMRAVPGVMVHGTKREEAAERIKKLLNDVLADRIAQWERFDGLPIDQR